MILEILRESELGILGLREKREQWHWGHMALLLCVPLLPERKALCSAGLIQVGALVDPGNEHSFPKLPSTLPKGNKRLEYLLNCLL